MTSPLLDSTAPGAGHLLRSTLIALAVASVLLVTCVLPAEYGVDPTGIGRMIGLTQMGEVKMALAEEAASAARAEAAADSVIAAAEKAGGGEGRAVPAAATQGGLRTDTSVVTLQPGKGAEVKLMMQGGEKATYRWTVVDGIVNYDMHGDSANAPKGWFVSYKKAQGVAADSGELKAGFSGAHGWYWRNRGDAAVVVRLVTRGTYREVTLPH